MKNIISGIWRGKPGASKQVIDKLISKVPIKLPKEYIEQLIISNGGEGDLGIDPGWISFWEAKDVVSLNRDYKVQEYLPGYYGFGSNGGGELFAFKIKENGAHPICRIPFIPLDESDSVIIARNFSALKKAIGIEYKDD